MPCSTQIAFAVFLQVLKLHSLLDLAQIANCGSEPLQHSRLAIKR